MIVAGGGVHHSGASAGARPARGGAAGAGGDLAQRSRRDPRGPSPRARGDGGPTRARARTARCTKRTSPLFVGSGAGSMTTNFWRLPRPGTESAQIDIAAEAIGSEIPVGIGHSGRRPDGPAADAGTSRRRRLPPRGRTGCGRCAPPPMPGSGSARRRCAPMRFRSVPSASARSSGLPGFPRTRWWWSTPGTRECGWRACSSSAAPANVSCAVPAISVGPFPPDSAPSAQPPSGRW